MCNASLASAQTTVISSFPAPLSTSLGGTGAISLSGASIPVINGTPTSSHCVEWNSSTTLSDAGSACATGGVSSFNTRTGTVTLSSSDVTTALSFTPPSISGTPTSSHCVEWASSSQLEDAGSACGSGSSGVSSFNTRTGAVTLSSGDVTTALSYTPLAPASNLSDVSSASTARSNLGIVSGTPTTGHCAQFASTTTLSDSGGACGGSGSGTLVLLNTLTASNSATLSDTTSITSTYTKYLIIFENLIPSASGSGDNPEIVLSVNGGSSYLSTGYTGYGGVTTYWTWAYPNVASMATQQSTVVNSGLGLTGQAYLFAPQSPTAGNVIMTGTGGANDVNASAIVAYQIQGAQSTTTTVNAIRFLFSTGNITSGKILIYGMS